MFNYCFQLPLSPFIASKFRKNNF